MRTSVVTAETTPAVVSKTRYYPFGAIDSQTAPAPTDRLFTGQRRLVNNEVYDYGNARLYNAYTGRFMQPDSIAPEAGNPQALNRYSYVVNNPLRYTDPTGHRWMDEVENCLQCGGGGGTEPAGYGSEDGFGAELGYGILAFAGDQGYGSYILEWLHYCGTGLYSCYFGGGCGGWVGLACFALEVATDVALGPVDDAAIFAVTTVGCVGPGSCQPVNFLVAAPGCGSGCGRFIKNSLKLADGARILRIGGKTWDISTYHAARKVTAGQGGDIQAHHILEKRHFRNWGILDQASSSPAVVLTKAEHDALTSDLRKALPYGHYYTRQQVEAAYEQVYTEHGHPEAFEAVRHYLR
jgi:RHS repeat-associated protein